ncbi:MAG: hypothetical protein Q8P20_09715 [bacterium]|nr:hypothetical protein [bacterium]
MVSKITNFDKDSWIYSYAEWYSPYNSVPLLNDKQIKILDENKEVDSMSQKTTLLGFRF